MILTGTFHISNGEILMNSNYFYYYSESVTPKWDSMHLHFTAKSLVCLSHHFFRVLKMFAQNKQ